MFDLRTNAEYAMSWLLKNHVDYFDHDPRQWIARTNVTTRALVYSMDRALLTYWLEDVLLRAPPEPWAYFRYVLTIVRELFLNQRQLRGDIFEGFHDDHFWQSAFVRLWRGQVNCEGQNHLFAILLARRFSDVALFETLDPETGRARHSLVVFSWENRRVFADAWSDVSLFHLHRDWKNAPLEMANFADLEARAMGERQGIQPRLTYEIGRIVPIVAPWPILERPIRDWDMPEPVEETVRPKEPGFVEYLEARRHHIWRRRAEALRSYIEILHTNVGFSMVRAARSFAERLREGKQEG